MMNEAENVEEMATSPVKELQSSWRIISGDLDSAVTCESSLSASDQSADDCPRHRPLSLCRSSPDSGPCEITLHFTQLHEIRQIYVRSTARIYEIYYATDEKGGNEYLCTVRCGLAARDEELLPETDGADSFSAGSSGSIVQVEVGHSSTESGSSTYEDGWVDVKAPNLSRVGNADGSLSIKKDSGMDRFEATAEISDADPVLSITLRLLSIQSGDNAYVDEVYVFADPVESSNEPAATSQESTSGGALLSMFMPTLMQLSKSRASKVQEHISSDAGEGSIIRDNEVCATATTATDTLKAEIMRSSMPNGAFDKCQSELPIQTPTLQKSPHTTYGESDSPLHKIEKTLDTLVSRVANVEDLFLRFEEKMLKPIIMMEARLERVEHQLQSFVKNPQIPKTGCTRYAAPEFSCTNSEYSSTNASGNDCPREMLKFESDEKDDDCCEELCVPVPDAYTYANVQHNDSQSWTGDVKLLPGLLVTAPEFSCIDDDEEENDSTEAVKDSSEDSLKRPMSIDDALASALSGFLSSVPIPVKCTDMGEEAQTVSAIDTETPAQAITSSPECSELVDGAENISINGGSSNIDVSASIQSDDHVVPSILSRTSTTSCTDVLITEKDPLTAANDGEVITDADNESRHVPCEGGRKEPLSASDFSSVDDLDNMERGCLNSGCESTEQDNDAAGQTLVSEVCNSPTFADRHNSSPSESLSAAAIVVPEEGGSMCPLSMYGIIEFQTPATLDYSAPVLDMKFLSLDSTPAKPSLEALLVDMPSSACDDPSVREENASPGTELQDLVNIEEGSPGNYEQFVSLCESGYTPSETEQQDGPNFSNQDKCASLI